VVFDTRFRCAIISSLVRALGDINKLRGFNLIINS
jgi:hypothetical protein